MSGIILGFEVEWYDNVSCDVKKMYLKFWPEDNTLELLKSGNTQTTFLKKIYYPDVKLQDLFIGGSLSIYNRIMIITNYANSFTKDYMISREIHYLVVLPSPRFNTLPKILNIAKQFSLSIARVRTAGSSVQDFLEYGDIVMELVGISGENVNDFISNVNRIDREVIVQNVPVEEITAYLEKCLPFQTHSNTTLCIIKPHVLKEGLTGNLIQNILSEGFTIESVFSIHMSLPIAETLFDVYRGLYPSYSKMMEHICSGPVLALLVSNNSNSVVESFRALCGPVEPELAQIIAPNTLRAKYGIDMIYNAVHCTDLPDDGEMETRYIFETLASL